MTLPVVTASLATPGPLLKNRLISAIMSRSTAMRFQLLRQMRFQLLRQWVASPVEKPTFFDRLDRLLRSFLGNTMSLGEGHYRHAHLVGMSCVVRGFVGPFLRPLEGFLDSTPRSGCPPPHLSPCWPSCRRSRRNRHARLSMPLAPLAQELKRIAGQTGVDALDRGVRFVDVHLDDEFGLIVRHKNSGVRCDGRVPVTRT